MKRDWKQHPLVVGGLLAVAVLVWSVFLLRIQGGDGEIPTPGTAIPGSVVADSSTAVELPYPEVTRDPFAPMNRPGHAGDEDGVDEPRRPPTIRHQLQGVIGSTALLLDPEGATHVVRDGDAVGDLEVLRVHRGHVEVRLNGHRVDITLD